MNQNQIPNSSLFISSISLGLMYVNDAKNTEFMYHKAIDFGINYIDTASNYENGESEKLLGKIIKNYDRSKIILGTKVFFKTGNSNLEQGLGKKHILSTIKNSLKNIGTDYIDIFYLHRYDEKTPIEETLYTIKHLLDTCQILYWGISSFSVVKMMKTIYTAKIMGLPMPIVGQYPYNIFNQSIDQEFKEAINELRLPLLTYYPLSQGILSGKYSELIPVESRATYENKKAMMWDFTEEKIAKVDQFVEIALSLDLKPTNLAYLWCLQNPNVISCITSISNDKQLEELLEFKNISIKEESINQINKLIKK